MPRAGSRQWLAAVGVMAALVSLGCGARGPLSLPTGAGEPDGDAAAAFTAATAACRQVRTLTAEVALSGRANGRRVRARLLVGVERPDRLRLEALAPFGAPVFVLVARDGRGRLWIPREQAAVADAPVADLVGAVAGLERSGEELVALLTGCVVAPGSTPDAGTRYANGWRRVPFGGTDVWLKDDGAGLRVVAGRLAASRAGTGRGERGLSVEYADHQGGLPRTVRLLAAGAGGTSETDLTLRLTGVDLNTDLDAHAFELAVPDGAREMTLDDLRRSGLFGSGT